MIIEDVNQDGGIEPTDQDIQGGEELIEDDDGQLTEEQQMQLQHLMLMQQQ